MSKIKVLAVDDIAETRENIRKCLQFEEDISIVGECENGKEAIRLAHELSPDVILMDINMPVMDGISATETITIQYPDIAVIIMSVQGEQEYLKNAMIAGAKEYIVKPFSISELSNTIRKVFKAEQKRKQTARTSVENKVTPLKNKTEVISLFSTKGGVGKTLIGSNLAVSIKGKTSRDVVLVDLDLQFGDLAIMFNINPKNSITEVAHNIDELDEKLLEKYLVKHESGIKILPAPSKPEYAELMTTEHIEKIIKLLKKNYDYIIIDTPPFFNDINLSILDASDQILLVTSLELPTIKNTRLSLEIFDSLHQKEKVKLVINRSTEEMGIQKVDLEATLEWFAVSSVPTDGRLIVSSVNKGVPFILSHPTAKISHQIYNLAEIVIKNWGTQKDIKGNKKKGFMSKIFNMKQ